MAIGKWNIDVFLVDVGHGNACLIYTENVLVIFDCGNTESSLSNISVDKGKKNLTDAIQSIFNKTKIKNLTPIFILSHPHGDHYSLYSSLVDKVFKKVIPVVTLEDNIYKNLCIIKDPQVKNYSATPASNGMGLGDFLNSFDPKPIPDNDETIRALNNIEIYYNKKVCEDKDAYMLDCTKEHYYKQKTYVENDIGFLLHINRENSKTNEPQSIILPGDMSYYFWPDNISNNADIIVVPHHYKVSNRKDNLKFKDNAKFYVTMGIPNKASTEHKKYMQSLNVDDTKFRYVDKVNRKKYYEL
ncbi:MAG: hypothetical protein MJ108_09000 [Saccharofermentans sp.]|nr:hypothetical protein [Saccharofermentans sp.]